MLENGEREREREDRDRERERERKRKRIEREMEMDRERKRENVKLKHRCIRYKKWSGAERIITCIRSPGIVMSGTPAHRVSAPVTWPLKGDVSSATSACPLTDICSSCKWHSNRF
jgi:hypothetical protein